MYSIFIRNYAFFGIGKKFYKDALAESGKSEKALAVKHPFIGVTKCLIQLWQ